jgi:hypothetical protein
LSRLSILADDVAVPGVYTELLPAEGEDGIELDGYPACLVTPVLKQGLPGLQELLRESWVETF